MKDYINIKKPAERDIYLLLIVPLLLFMSLVAIFVSKMWYGAELKLFHYQRLSEVHTHVWMMDKSCSDQLTNSMDGILRIKTK